MSKKNTLEDFIVKANVIHKNKYDYSLSVYCTALIKLTILCPLHGEFEKSPNKHISREQGCPECGMQAGGKLKISRVTKGMFVAKANKKHNFKYNYTLSDYQGSVKKINILCKIHGMFSQVPKKHLFGDGCPECGNARVSEKARKNPTGWSYTNWESAGNKSKLYDSFKVYLIRCWNEEEEFFKLGKTYHTVKNRFKGEKRMPYKYEVVKVWVGTAKEVSELETKLKKDNMKQQYIPKIRFNGRYECFGYVNK